MLATEPIVMFLSLWVAFNFATVYCFFVAFPVVFTEVYSLSIEQGGLTFISILIGSILGGVLSITCDTLIYKNHYQRSKTDASFVMTPEKRLYGAMIGSVLSPVGFFWFAWTTKENIHWMCPMVTSVFIACGNVLVFISVTLYLIETYLALLSASALARMGFSDTSLGRSFHFSCFRCMNAYTLAGPRVS